jgi:hypothetical protein
MLKYKFHFLFLILGMNAWGIVKTQETPNPSEWIIHYYKDLLPFWRTDKALGSPIGRFETFRNDDGSRINPAFPLEKEFKKLSPESDAWILDRMDRNYVRMMSRQVYFYGVGYHMTGDPKLLEYARLGTKYLLDEAFKDTSGSIVTYWKNGNPDAHVKRRTSQDLAYGLIGPSFYYYLTKDSIVGSKILKSIDFIFSQYMNKNDSSINWVNESYKDGPDSMDTNSKELVATLDQVNAYLVLLSNSIDGYESVRMRSRLIGLLKVLKTDFYSKKYDVFWGRLNITPEDNFEYLGADHVDFGHTVKTFLMFYCSGLILNNSEFKLFGESGIRRTLATAYDKENGTWNEKKVSNGNIKNSVWWIHAELDQAAATISLLDSTFEMKYLNNTYRFWLDKFVDKEFGEVWHQIDSNGISHYPKQHLWKNGFHSAEHNLIAYITSSQRKYGSVILYFGGDAAANRKYVPYIYLGNAKEITVDPTINKINYKTIRVKFKIQTGH